LTTYVVSDLHLKPDCPSTARLFFRFLDDIAPRAQRLVLLGDIVEAWAGTGHLAQPLHAELAARLFALTRTGTRVAVMRGNRDFLIGDDFYAATGAQEWLDPHVETLEDGIPTLFMHGDTLCTDDLKYQDWYRTSRNPVWRANFLSRPYEERLAEVNRLRKVSETAQQNGDAMEAMLFDVNVGAVEAALRTHAVTRLIHGHTHRPARHTLPDGCERWVLTDWDADLSRAGYLVSDTNGLRALPFTPA
jgi:UDP-2,3-diacylglucosamine hydrolase